MSIVQPSSTVTDSSQIMGSSQSRLVGWNRSFLHSFLDGASTFYKRWNILRKLGEGETSKNKFKVVICPRISFHKKKPVRHKDQTPNIGKSSTRSHVGQGLSFSYSLHVCVAISLPSHCYHPVITALRRSSINLCGLAAVN